jgi:YidC/Oxa1 family membrane protein insertase
VILALLAASPLKPIEDVLTWGLEELHTKLGLSWGWSIIGLTVIVRMLLVPVVVRQIHSMQSLQAHAPEMKAIQQRYKGDRAKMNEELMKFYKENNINPASSCLPTLFQIPIFFSLYFVLRGFEKEVFPKYPASDLGWLHLVPNITGNITAHWSGYVLLAVYVVSQVSSTYFMSTTMDKTQRWLFMFLPVVFVPFIINPPGGTVFPVGLLMYWMTTNLWVVGQGLMTRRLIPRGPVTPPKKTSRTPPRGGEAGDGAKPKPAGPKPTPAGAGTRRVTRKKKARR